MGSKIIKIFKCQQLMLINNYTAKKQIKNNAINQPDPKSKPKYIPSYNKQQPPSMNKQCIQQQYPYLQHQHEHQHWNEHQPQLGQQQQYQHYTQKRQQSNTYVVNQMIGKQRQKLQVKSSSRGGNKKSSSQNKYVKDKDKDKERNILRLKQKQSSKSKQKQKEKHKQNKIIRQEYYIGESGLDKDKDRGNKNKINNKDKVKDKQKLKQREKLTRERQKSYDNIDQPHENVYERYDSNSKLDHFASCSINPKITSPNPITIQKINRSKLPELKTVITFQGKIIKIPPKYGNQYEQIYHNYTSLSSYEDGITTHQQFTNQKLKNHKNMKTQRKINKSKQKNNKNVQSNSKSSKSSFKSVFKSKGLKQNKNKHSYSQQLIPSSSPLHPHNQYPFPSNLPQKSYNQFQKQPSTFQFQSHKANLLINQQTQVSPFKQKQKQQSKQYQRPQKIDLQQIYELIQQDLNSANQIKIHGGQQVIKQRKLCIKFISELCGEIGLRRDTFYLAVSIFDRVLSKKAIIQNYIMLALVCLTLAMKLQQARLAQQFVYVLSIVNSGKQSYLQSISSCKSSSKPKSMPHQKSKQKANKINIQSATKIHNNNTKNNNAKNKDGNFTNKNNANNTKFHNYMKICLKQQNINMKKISLSNISKILRKYNCTKISKHQFISLEQKITIYLRFRLWRIQAIFWADLLTCLWDQHIINQSHSQSNTQIFTHSSSPTHSQSNTHAHTHTHSQSRSQTHIQGLPLLFRASSTLQNIAHLYYLLQLAYQCPQIYKYPSIHVVLSAIYLIIRLIKQNKQGNQNNTKIIDYYKQSLSNSTNILFVDRSGVNQLFWIFINKIRIQMVDILGCCQFMSQFLGEMCINRLKCNCNSNNNQNSNNFQQNKTNFQQKCKQRPSIDNLLSIHSHKPDLYSNIN